MAVTSHSGSGRTAAPRDRLALVLLLTLAILIVEVVGSIVTGSLALLSDAGHVLVDILGLSIALAAVWVAQRPPTKGRTFGLQRLEVLAATLNAILLLVIAVFVVVQALRRLSRPVRIEAEPMLAFALVGLAANGVALVLLRDAQHHSLNARGAYLEVFGDLASASAVIAAAIVIAVSGWTLADVVASAAIGLLILPRTLALLLEAMHILLEGTPHGVDIDQVRRHIRDAPGVVDCHDLHAWTITSGVNVVSAHVVLADGTDPARALDALSECLADDFEIEHSTFQLEAVDRRPFEERAHA